MADGGGEKGKQDTSGGAGAVPDDPKRHFELLMANLQAQMLSLQGMMASQAAATPANAAGADSVPAVPAAAADGAGTSGADAANVANNSNEIALATNTAAAGSGDSGGNDGDSAQVCAEQVAFITVYVPLAVCACVFAR